MPIADFVCNWCSERIDCVRFKCLECLDFDLCEKCGLSENVVGNGGDDSQHTHDHLLLKVYLDTTVCQTPSSDSASNVAGQTAALLEELSVIEAMDYFQQGF